MFMWLLNKYKLENTYIYMFLINVRYINPDMHSVIS